MKIAGIVLAMVALFLIGCRAVDKPTLESVRQDLVQGIRRTDLESYLLRNEIQNSVITGEDLKYEIDLPSEPNNVTARYIAFIPKVRRWMIFYEVGIVIKVDIGMDDRAINVVIYESSAGP